MCRARPYFAPVVLFSGITQGSPIAFYNTPGFAYQIQPGRRGRLVLGARRRAACRMAPPDFVLPRNSWSRKASFGPSACRLPQHLPPTHICGGQAMVIDGPFAETKEAVCWAGFSFLFLWSSTSENLNAARWTWRASCPMPIIPPPASTDKIPVRLALYVARSARQRGPDRRGSKSI